MAKRNQSSQFKITEVVISADRMGGFDAQSFDITSQVIELNLFENLDNPYIQGTVLLSDDKALFDRIGFYGTERMKVTICPVDNDLTPVMSRTFIMRRIIKERKANDSGKSTVYQFELVDELLYRSRVKKISKAFNGNIDDVIKGIVLNDLGIDLDVSYLFLASGDRTKVVQSNIKGIVPDLTPLETLRWLLARASTENGSPYFLYASIHDDNLRLGNLDSFLQQEPWNSKLPYSYNPANVSVAEDQGEFQKGFIIKDILNSSSADTYEMLKTGSLGSRYANTNLNTGQITKNKYSFLDTTKRLGANDIVNLDRINVYDAGFKIDELHADEHTSHHYHTITSAGTYGGNKGYHDEFQEALFKKKLEKKAIKNHLIKNSFDVVVTGTAFFISKASVGDVVSLRVINDNVEVGMFTTPEELLDKRKSGDFLIYRTRHTFIDNQHTVAMTVCSMEDGNV